MTSSRVTSFGASVLLSLVLSAGLASNGMLTATHVAPTSTATTHVIFDVTGYFMPPF